MKIFPFVAAFLMIAPLSALAADPVDVPEAELISLLKGKNLTVDNVRWGSVRLQLQENGGLYGSASGGSDSGKWRVEGSKLCLEWRKWDYEGCGLVQKVGDKFQHLWPNGGLHFTFIP